MKNPTISKEEYLKLRETMSRTDVRLQLKLGPIAFDRMLQEIGIDPKEDKTHRINRKSAVNQ